MSVFNGIDNFFASLNIYVNYNVIFVTFMGLFVFAGLVAIISTSNAYEAKLIKAIDKFNNYFIKNPHITDENLIAFNNKMKARGVPKQLRKQWQQFVLYREDKASHYMSFENCVAAPLRNSTYKRDVSVFNKFSYILAFVCLLLNLYYSFEGNINVQEYTVTFEFSKFLQHLLLCPILIIILNHIATIFFDFRHNAIVDDLNQNFQYFEVNIDKATETLPEYVDYEVLFDKNEIKRGIPILYIYLQRRAEEEQRELERAQLKNVEHEKFNFDEAGVASSLVLERAMQEAENYIAERKKCMQDIEQVNSEITQEEINFRETTKEYQRQMQVSKETFDNFKDSLAEASSSIQINYLKKQQQQELDRQRNLERDYDTATERHNSLIQNLQDEITQINDQIKQARQTLEKGMMSEFATYSEKVYAEAEKVAIANEAEKTDQLQADVRNLENELDAKNKELDSAYNQNRHLSEMLGIQYNADAQDGEQTQYAEDGQYAEESVNDTQYEQQEQPEYDENDTQYDQNEAESYDENEDYQQEETEEDQYYDEEQTDENELETGEDNEQEGDEYVEDEQSETDQDEQFEDNNAEYEHYTDSDEDDEEGDSDSSLNSTSTIEDESTGEGLQEKTPKRRGRPKKVVESTSENEEGEKATATKRRGRPKKTVDTTTETDNATTAVKKRGRPKKTVEKETSQTVTVEPAKRRGRPKKEQTIVVETQSNAPAAKKRGRPKKNVDTSVETNEETTQNTSKQPAKRRGRPKKSDAQTQTLTVISNSHRDIDEIEKSLKEINDRIAEENAKLEETKRKLEQNSKIKNKKR